MAVAEKLTEEQRAALTAQDVFDRAFTPGRTPRSAAYRQGVLQQLRYRMKESGRDSARCPYTPGTAQADAFWAGQSEAWSLLELYQVDRRKGEQFVT